MRGEERRAELAVRMALGAGGGRIVRQLIVESLLPSLISTAVGVVATWGSLPWMLALVPEGLTRVRAAKGCG